MLIATPMIPCLWPSTCRVVYHLRWWYDPLPFLGRCSATSANDPVAYQHTTIGLLDVAHQNICWAAPPYRRWVLAASRWAAVPHRPPPSEMGSACWTMCTTRSFVFVVFLYSPIKKHLIPRMTWINAWSLARFFVRIKSTCKPCWNRTHVES